MHAAKPHAERRQQGSAPQGGLALVDKASPHVHKKLEGLLNGAVSPGAWPPFFPVIVAIFLGIPYRL